MKRPKIVMCNSVSLDGSFVGFKVEMGLHLSLTRDYWAFMTLEGSESIVTGIKEMYKGNLPAEVESDFVKPDKGPGTSYFVVPDSGGITQGLLHISRRFGFCRDVIVLVAEKTSSEFIDYLEERHIDYLVCGKEKVDFAKALDWLSDKYGVETMMVDAGPTLNRVLLEQGLIDEIILLVHPILVGSSSDKLLSHLVDTGNGIKLELMESTEAENGTVLLHYRVL